MRKEERFFAALRMTIVGAQNDSGGVEERFFATLRMTAVGTRG